MTLFMQAVRAASLSVLYLTPMTSIFLCQPSLTYLCSRHFYSRYMPFAETLTVLASPLHTQWQVAMRERGVCS